MTEFLVGCLVVCVIVIAPLAIFFANRRSSQEDTAFKLESPALSKEAELSQTVAPTVEVTVRVERQLSELLPNQFVVVDLETTGLSPIADEIIEIGAIKVSLDSDRHVTFQTLVRPSVKLSRKII